MDPIGGIRRIRPFDKHVKRFFHLFSLKKRGSGINERGFLNDIAVKVQISLAGLAMQLRFRVYLIHKSLG